jgi:SAM-dependent methyltransferase
MGNNEQKQRMNVVSPLRHIVGDLTEENVEHIPQKSKVLEVGCGTQDLYRKLLEANNCLWIGVDAMPNTIATNQGTVAKLPFEDNSFDFVICSQSIEHWYEYSSTFKEGLGEMFRVLEKGGIIFLDYPLYLHGHPFFMLGMRKAIQSFVLYGDWKVLELGEITTPKPYYSWDGTHRKLWGQWLMLQWLKFKNHPSLIGRAVLQKQQPFTVKRDLFFWIEKIIYCIWAFPDTVYNRFRQYIR